MRDRDKLRPIPSGRQQKRPDSGRRMEHKKLFGGREPGELDAAEGEEQGDEDHEQRRLNRALSVRLARNRAVEPGIAKDNAWQQDGHQGPGEYSVYEHGRRR